MYRTIASSVSKRETELIEPNLNEQRFLDEQLAAEHQELIQELDESMSDYLGLLEQAFSPGMQIALLGSVELARQLGVPTVGILDSEEKIDACFLD